MISKCQQQPLTQLLSLHFSFQSRYLLHHEKATKILCVVTCTESFSNISLGKCWTSQKLRSSRSNQTSADQEDSSRYNQREKLHHKNCAYIQATTTENSPPHIVFVHSLRMGAIVQLGEEKLNINGLRQWLEAEEASSYENDDIRPDWELMHGLANSAQYFCASNFSIAHFLALLSPRCKFAVMKKNVNVQQARLWMCLKEKCIKFHHDILITINGSKKARLKS